MCSSGGGRPQGLTLGWLERGWRPGGGGRRGARCSSDTPREARDADARRRGARFCVLLKVAHFPRRCTAALSPGRATDTDVSSGAAAPEASALGSGTLAPPTILICANMASRSDGGSARSSFLSRKSGDGIFRSRQSSRYSSVLHAPEDRGWRGRLAARSRVTNLGIGLLVVFAVGSLFLNFRHWTSRPPAVALAPPDQVHAAPSADVADAVKSQTSTPVPGTENLEHLVIVVGQAVWAGSSFDGREQDSNWDLEDYQKGGSVKTYWKQLEKGITITNKDPNALLVVSGGQTRPHSPATEAESYFNLALKSPLDLPILPGARVLLKTSGEHGAAIAQFFDEDHDGVGEKKAKPYGAPVSKVQASSAHAPAPALVAANVSGLGSLRMTTETYALDTYENLVYSIARFREVTNHYPQRITVVGYEVHKERFELLHTKAIRWPDGELYRNHKRWTFVGIDDEGDNSEQYHHERGNSFALFDKDMYGCHGVLLVRARDRTSFLPF